MSSRSLYKNRVWEIDAVRGLIMLGLLIVHLFFTVDAFCINGYYNIDPYRYIDITDPLHFWFDWNEDGVIVRGFFPEELLAVWMPLCVDTFFTLSGICCLFSRDNLRRGLITLGAALFISAFTKGIDLFYDTNEFFIRFGALHCYGFCYLIYYYFFEARSNKTLLISTVVIWVVGYHLRYYPVELNTSLLLPFGFYERGVSSVDYWPIFPMLGWLLFGVVLGRKIYPEKRSLLPDCSLQVCLRPLCFLGRHSGKIYVGHIVIYTVVFCGIGYIFGLY